MKRKTLIYYLNAIYFIYSENCVTAFKESFNGSLTKVLRKARQKAKTLKCDNWYIESMFPKYYDSIVPYYIGNQYKTGV